MYQTAGLADTQVGHEAVDFSGAFVIIYVVTTLLHKAKSRESVSPKAKEVQHNQQVNLRDLSSAHNTYEPLVLETDRLF